MKYILPCVLGCVVTSTAGVARAELLSYFNFNDSNLDRDGGITGTLTTSFLNIDYFDGTTSNTLGSDGSTNKSLVLVNSANNGRWQTYHLSMLGFQDLELTYASSGKSNGFNTHTISYSTDNQTYTPIQTITGTNVPTFSVKTVDLGSATSLNNATHAYIRITLTGAQRFTSDANNRFDNVQFNAAALVSGNDTTITATPLFADFGRVIVGAAPTESITLDKTGSDTTGYTIARDGDATSTSLSGSFLGGPQSASFDLGVDTATAGVKTGTAVVANAAVSSAASGQGSLDPDDTIAVSATVLNPSNASFDAAVDQDVMTINLGIHQQGAARVSESFDITNLLSSGGITSALDLDSVEVIGSDAPAISTDLSMFFGLDADSTRPFNAFLDTTDVGVFSERLLLTLSDEDVLGETTNQLTLNLVGSVVAVPEPSSVGLLVLGGLCFLARRRAS